MTILLSHLSPLVEVCQQLLTRPDGALDTQGARYAALSNNCIGPP